MAYTAVTEGALQVRGILGYARNVYESERDLTIGSETTRASGRHDAQEWSSYAEANYTIQGPAEYQLQPLLALRYSRLSEDAFTETGSLGNLAVAARATQSLLSDVGARLIRPFAQGAGAVELRAIWGHEFAAAPSQMEAHLAGDLSGSSFAVTGASPHADGLQFGVSVAAHPKKNVTAHLDYNAQPRAAGGTQQFFTAGVSYVW
jgi:outer membrane autotransporter protein